MTAEVELLPCPFCGGAPGVVHTTDVDDTKWVHVECYGCGARTRGDWIPPSSDQCPIFFQEVRAEWNRRANVSHAAAPLQAEVEALREQLRLSTVDQVNAEAEANDARAEIERLAKALSAYQAAVNKIDDLIEYSLPMPPETKAALYAVLANLTATLAKELTND